MKRIAIFFALTALLSLAASLKAENALTATKAESAGKAFITQNEQERFELWNSCLPVRLYVSVGEVLAPDALSPSNLHPKVEAVARSMLQDAGLYDPSSVNLVSPALYLLLTLDFDEFEIHTSYRKRVADNVTGELGYIIAWTLDYGPHFAIRRKHNTDPEYLLHWVAKHTDRFIEEYRRVNADACTHR